MNALRNAALLAAAVVAMASAQTQPVTPSAAPACLSGPMTRGTLTVNCTAVDTTGSLVAALPGLQSGILTALPYVLFVRGTSTDPDVLGVRVTVVFTITGPSGTVDQVTQSGTVANPAPQSSGSLVPFTSWTYAFAPGASASVVSIQVQELKASSSQSF